ncbi:caspase, EACC1-associated type [Kribbella sp. CA-253562]|uniref:caspase, EACC1-associated type n=1 Tax=Kribbella sp. CA-253562 TaxID=3239942 RepID=UPI003D8D94CC
MARRLALLVATYEYEDSGLRRLTSPAQDAEALAAVLADPEIAGFDVRTLINQPTHRVGEAIAEFYAGSERDDLTLLYFTGHGLKDDSGRLHLALANTRRDNLRFTALSAQLVDEALEDGSSRQKILILDCCYSGAYATQQYAKADTAVHTMAALGGRGRMVLTASDSTQYAFEGSLLHGAAQQSVFTRHLVDGLRSGDADLDRDGDITVDELYDYVYRHVTAEQPNQRPKKLSNVEGETVIAANVRWSLPEAITTALESPLPAVRQSAVSPLALLLTANNERVRRTARARLQELRDDDSRAVAAAAEAALSPPTPNREARSSPSPPGIMPTVERPVPLVEPGPPELSRPPMSQARSPSPSSGISGEPTLRTVLRTSVRRWRSRLHRPTVLWPIFAPSLLGAIAATLAAILVVRQALGAEPVNDQVVRYLVAVAILLCAAVVLHVWRPSNAAAFLVGSLGGAVAGSALLGAWWSQLRPLVLPLKEEAGLVTSAVIAHAAWLAAGIVGLVVLWRSDGTTARRALSPLGKAIVLTGAASALIVLLILFFSYRQGASFHIAARTVPIVLAAELALAGPLLAASINQRRTFLGGWVLGGFALYLGLFGIFEGGSRIEILESALYGCWLVLGVLAVRWTSTSAGERPGRWRPVVAALLVPLVLGGATAFAVPEAPKTPVALGLVVSPASDYLYAADVVNGTVVKVSTTTREQIGEALVVGDKPSRIAMSPDGSRLYVSNSGSSSVSVVDTGAWTLLGSSAAVAPEPLDLELNVPTKRLYVLSPESETITVLDTTTMRTIGGPIATGPAPSDLAVSPDGRRLYISGKDTASVAVIDTSTRSPLHTPIEVGATPEELVFGLDGNLYVVGGTAYAVINTKVERSRPTPRELPGRARVAAVSADGERLFVLASRTDNTQAVDVVDIGSGKTAGAFESDAGLLTGLAVSPDGQRIYVSRLFEEGILVLDTSGPKAVGVISLDG